MSYTTAPVNHMRAISLTSQAIASTTAGQVVLYDSTETPRGITCVNGDAASPSRFILPQIGNYVISIYATVSNSDSISHSLQLWVKKDNVDIPASCATVTVAATSVQTCSRNIIFDGLAADNVEVWIAGDNTGIGLFASAASAGTPSYPATPSIVVDIHMIGSGAP